MGSFFIKKATDGQFYFLLRASNGEPIATSEMYKTKSGCENGIRSVRENAPDASVIDMTE